MSLLLLLPTSRRGPSPLGLNAPGAINLLLRGFAYAPVTTPVVNNTTDTGDVTSWYGTGEFGQGSQTFDGVGSVSGGLITATADFGQGSGTFDATAALLFAATGEFGQGTGTFDALVETDTSPTPTPTTPPPLVGMGWGSHAERRKKKKKRNYDTLSILLLMMDP